MNNTSESDVCKRFRSSVTWP